VDEVDVVSRQLHIYDEELNIRSLCWKWHVIVSAGNFSRNVNKDFSPKARTKDLTLKESRLKPGTTILSLRTTITKVNIPAYW